MGKYPLLLPTPQMVVFLQKKNKKQVRKAEGQRITLIHFIIYAKHARSEWNRFPSPSHLHVFPDFSEEEEEEEACSDREAAHCARNIATSYKFAGFNHSRSGGSVRNMMHPV